MRFHGFSSPQEWAHECIKRGWEVRLEHLHRVEKPCFELPEGLHYMLRTPQHGDVHTDISIDPPEEVVLMTSNPRTSPSAITWGHIFNADQSLLYADGTEADCRRLLKLWGYADKEGNHHAQPQSDSHAAGTSSHSR